VAIPSGIAIFYCQLNFILINKGGYSMEGTYKNFYVEPNQNLQGYDIMKRNHVLKPDGTMGPEKICTIYSMEYLTTVLDAIIAEDNAGTAKG
jgi:hypothetical protein